MGTKAMLCLIGSCLLGSGCSVVSTASRVVCARVKESLSECAERSRNKEWARAAWQSARAANPGVAYSGDYEKGFEAGFTEHLYRGAIQPPPLPPASYRGARYQTPQGYQDILSWFAGFRHGVTAAQAGGGRDIVTGPSSSRQSAPPSGPVIDPGVAAPDVAAQPAEGGMPRGGRFIRDEWDWALPW